MTEPPLDYLGANVAYYLVIPWNEMAGIKHTPVATVFSLRLLGSIGGVAMSAAIMSSVFGALNGNILASGRKQDVLCSRLLAEAFDSALALRRSNGRYSLAVAPRARRVL